MKFRDEKINVQINDLNDMNKLSKLTFLKYLVDEWINF